MRQLYFILICLGLSAQWCWGQQGDISLKVVVVDREEGFLGKKYQLKESYRLTENIDKGLRSLVSKLQREGYVMASVDSLVKTTKLYTAYLNIGEQYEWVSLEVGNLDDGILNQVGFKEKFYTGKPFNYKDIDVLIDKILRYHENNGYPFAEVSLDSLTFEGSKVSGQLHLEKNQLLVYDTLALVGDVRVTKGFLYNYLGIKPNKLYDEQVVSNISRRLKELPYLAETQPPKVIFTDEKAIINLYLKDRNSSQFDFLIGFLPNNDVSGRLLVTGEANLRLESPFGTGKTIALNWKKLQARTQELDLKFSYPYVLSFPLGLDAEFELYKRDTLYLNLDYEIGVQYLFIGRNYFEAFFKNQLTNVLNVDTNVVKQTRALPTNSDVRNTMFGIEFNFENLDYRLNPRSGTVLNVKAAAGTKRIVENSAISDLSDPENSGGTFAYLYDSIDTRIIQYKLDYRLEKYWPIKKRGTVLTALVGGAYISDNIFLNELYRIGGTQILRGFDEENIFVSLFNVVTAEYRFLLSPNSYFSLFFDGAYVEDRSGGGFENDFPFGFGAGLAFETRAGLFGVSYALGSQQGNGIDFRSAKIHFGYVNYF